MSRDLACSIRRPGLRNWIVCTVFLLAAGCGGMTGGAGEDLAAGGADLAAPDLAPADAARPPDLARDLWTGCQSDADCAGATPRCDLASHLCVPCLPQGDNCPEGKRCAASGNSYSCESGCKADAECRGGDGGRQNGRCCDGACVDADVDPKHCGACGNACAPGGACCGGACRDVASDVKNCGGCGRSCALPNTQVSCQMGACGVTGCNAGFGDCDGQPQNGCETDVTATVQHCGACGKACSLPNAMAVCFGGLCNIDACAAGFLDCNGRIGDGCEIDGRSDVNNCGQCFRLCARIPHGAGSCQNGACVAGACDPGFGDCDRDPKNGCESDLAADAKNCGACGRACVAPPNRTATCVNNQCVPGACLPGFTDCDMDPANGCEADVRIDAKNCGACGNACPAAANGAARCAGGQCTFACNPGFGDCNNDSKDGCEVDLSTDARYCGSCQVTCGNGQTCGSEIAATMATQPSDWTWNGSAVWSMAYQSAMLTDAVASQAGTVIYKNPVLLDDFDATFEIRTGSGGGADGLAFFVQRNGANFVGQTGGGLGVSGATGFGVEFDDYNNGNCGDGANNHVAVDDLAACGAGLVTHVQATPNLPFSLRNTGWHPVRVQFAGGRINVIVDGNLVLQGVQAPNLSNSPYWFGFGGGCGAINDRHEVRNISIKFATRRCL